MKLVDLVNIPEFGLNDVDIDYSTRDIQNMDRF